MGEYRSQIKPLYGTPISPTHWAAQGLVGQWTMNEGSGLIAHDSSGNGNHGTLTNMSNTPISGWVPGPHSGALAFPGGGPYVSLSSNMGVTKTGIYTISVMFSPLTVTTNSCLINLSLTSADRNGIVIGGGKVGGGFWNGSGYVVKSGTITAGGNYYAVLRNVSGTISFFLNALEQTSTDQPSAYEGGKNYIGYNGNSPNFSGLISSVSIYNRALSAEEIAYLNQNPWCMYEDQSPISLQGGNASAMNYYQQLLAGGQ